MDWTQIGTDLALALIPILVLVLTALITLGAGYVRERWQWTKESRTIEEVEAMARGTVLELQQTIVDDLKAANEDGKLTDAEKAEIKRRALEALEKQITSGQRKVLAAVTADMSTWLGQRLEEALVSHKLDLEEVAGASPLAVLVPAEAE